MLSIELNPADPWFKGKFSLVRGPHRLELGYPHDVFSTQRVDEGTLLLLDHLPTPSPRRILDMGCGYGALGLPIAAKFPSAQIEMVDRDLLAVDWANRNAKHNRLPNAVAHGSLGYRDVARGEKYDWILCNVPARIGSPFIANLFYEGAGLLNPGGEIRVVVITDLASVLLELKKQYPGELNSLQEIARGPRHVIFALPNPSVSLTEASPDLYLRDQVTVSAMTLERPFDLGGDDPLRLRSGIPALLDALPRQAPRVPYERILCFRSGYGVFPKLCRNRWPSVPLTVIERDLLAATYIRRNAGECELRECAHFPGAIAAGETFSLILGELSPSAGEAVAQAELSAIAQALTPLGEAYLLCLSKIEKSWVRPWTEKAGVRAQVVLAREGYSIVCLSAKRSIR